MTREIKLKHVSVYKNIFDEFSVVHFGMKVKVTVSLAKFDHLIFHYISRWLFNADSEISYSKRHQ